MKINLSAEDLKKPHTDRSKYDLENCYSCGRSFLRNNGYTTKLAREDGQERWFCSEHCKEWHLNSDIVFNPSYKEQKAIEHKLNDVPLSEFKVVAGPPGTVGTNPWQGVVDATERIKAKSPIDDPCLWCGYSISNEDDPGGDSKFCRPKCKEWYLEVQKREKENNKNEPKPNKEIKKPMSFTDKQKLLKLAEHLNISPKRVKNGGYATPTAIGRKGNIYYDGEVWVLSLKDISKRYCSSVEKKLSFMKVHSFQEQARDVLNPDSKRAYNVGFSLDRMPSETEAEMVRKIGGFNPTLKNAPTTSQSDIALAA